MHNSIFSVFYFIRQTTDKRTSGQTGRQTKANTG